MELLKITRRPPVLARPENIVSEAAALMAQEGVGAVVVVNAEKQVQGIFTLRDKLLRVTFRRRDPDTMRLSEVMSTPVRTVSPEMTGNEGLNLMIRNRLRHLPIVDKANHVVAIASLFYPAVHRIGE